VAVTAVNDSDGDGGCGGDGGKVLCGGGDMI